MIKECNHYMAQLCDYSLEDVLDTCFASLFHTGDITHVKSLSEGSIKDPNGLESLEAKLICKNGHQIPVEISAARCTLQKNPATLCIVRDISQHLAADTEIRKHRTLDSIVALSGGIAAEEFDKIKEKF